MQIKTNRNNQEEGERETFSCEVSVRGPVVAWIRVTDLAGVQPDPIPKKKPDPTVKKPNPDLTLDKNI